MVKTLLNELQPPTCEVCLMPLTGGHPICHVCGRQFHVGSCGGTYTWSEVDIPEFDPDEAFRSKFLPGYNDRPPRGPVVTQELCIVCRRNDFGRYGVPPGEKQWKNALAVLRREPHAIEAARLEANRRAVQALDRKEMRELKANQSSLEGIEWRRLLQLVEVEILRENLEEKLREAREESARLETQISQYWDKANAASEARNQITAQWLQLREEASEYPGALVAEYEAELDELASRRTAASRQRDQAYLEAERSAETLSTLQSAIMTFETEIEKLRRDESSANARFQEARSAVEASRRKVTSANWKRSIPRY